MKVKIRIWRTVLVVLVLVAALITAGCSDNTRLEFSYSPAPAAVASAPAAPRSVTVYEFGDARQNQVYVGEAKADYMNPLAVVYYQMALPVGQVVTEAIVRNLESQGFNVVRASGWNLDPAGLRDIATELAVGGTVKAFWVEAEPYFSSESALVNVHVVIADAAGKRVLWEGDIVGTETFNTNTFAKAFLETRPDPAKLLQKAFSGAIDDLSTNLDIQRALKTPIPSALGFLVRF